MMPPDSPVIVFDGICVLCNGWVRFLLARDKGRYRFAAMQSPAGKALLLRHGLDPDDPVSFLLVDGARAWTNSEAIIRVLAPLGSGWRLAVVARLLPAALRNAAYRWVARNRYRWFGQHTTCMLPDAAVRSRFL